MASYLIRCIAITYWIFILNACAKNVRKPIEGTTYFSYLKTHFIRWSFFICWKVLQEYSIHSRIFFGRGVKNYSCEFWFFPAQLLVIVPFEFTVYDGLVRWLPISFSVFFSSFQLNIHHKQKQPRTIHRNINDLWLTFLKNNIIKKHIKHSKNN